MSGMDEVEMPEPDEVPRRLRGLGLSVDLLIAAVRRGQGAADFCTESHPRTYPGSVAWGETVAGLRDGTAVLGWSNTDADHIPRTISPDGNVTVTAVSGDFRTGSRLHERPQTKRRRGAAGMRIVRRNAQLEMVQLLPDDELGHGDGETVALGPMWYLLYHRDEDVVRSELSFATGVSDAGVLLSWKERLILPEINLLDFTPGGRRSNDLGPDVDVPVQRRAS